MTAGPPSSIAPAPIMEPFPLEVDVAEGGVDRQVATLRALGCRIGSPSVTDKFFPSTTNQRQPTFHVFNGFDLCEPRKHERSLHITYVQLMAGTLGLELPTMAEQLQCFIAALREPGMFRCSRFIGYFAPQRSIGYHAVCDLESPHLYLVETRKMYMRYDKTYVVLVKR